MSKTPATARESTLTRSDVEWAPNGEKPCTCRRADCLICEVEALAGDGEADAAELEAEVMAARFDDDPNPYEGTYDDWGFCGDDF